MSSTRRRGIPVTHSAKVCSMIITRRNAIALFPAMVATSSFSQDGAAQTKEGAQPPAEIVSIIDAVFKAYSSKDFASLKSVYADNNLVIIDGFGRFRWIGPNALNDWRADVEIFLKDFGVENEHLSNEGIRAWGVSGDRAPRFTN